jgi:hypothetical protein
MRVLAFLVTLLASLSASAQMSLAMNALDLVDAKVEYQADYRLVSGKWIYDGKVFHAPHRERWEFTIGNSPQVLLLRRDLDEAAMLWPQRRWYMSANFSFLSNLVGGLDTQIIHGREAGFERMDGETVVRYHVDKGGFVGDFWRSQDGILVRAKGRITYYGQPTEGELTLYNVRRTKTEPSLFVRPPDYFGIPFKTGK